MKKISSFAALFLSLAIPELFGGHTVDTSTSENNGPIVETHPSLPFEFHAEATYVGDGDLERIHHPDINDFDESDVQVRFVLTPRVKIGILRLGAQYERYSFGFGSNGPLPDVLHSASLIVGLDTEFSDSFLIRLEAQPGFYGTDESLDGDTFNVPAIIGGTYIFNSSFQIVFGVGIDALRKYPVLPGGGIRWKFAPQWVLNAVVPTPRLEYEVSSVFTLYGGADIRATSYRVDNSFGTARGNTAFNHAAITYEEVRTGVGFDWKVSPSIKLTAEGGLVPYRNFDFHRLDARYHQDGGAPYGMAALQMSF